MILIALDYGLKMTEMTLTLQRLVFRDLDLIPNSNPGFEPNGNEACSFPGPGICPTQYPKLDIPQCMADFLENYAHPYTDPDPDNDYMGVWLSIDVDYDLDLIHEGDIVYPSGTVLILIIKTDDVWPHGCVDVHDIVINCDADEILQITRVDDTWEIAVNDDMTRFYRGIFEC